MRTLLLLSVFAVSCGATAIDVARGTLTTAAVATVAADQAFGTAYGIASEAARKSSTTQQEKDWKMTDWDKAADDMEHAQALARASLVTAEVAVDGFERTGDAGYWDEAIACVAESLRRIAHVLEERGLHIPAALAKVLTLSEGLTCAASVR